MVASRKKVRSQVPIPLGLTLGAGTSLAMTFLGTAILSWLIGNERLPEERMGIAAAAVLLFAGMLGAWIAASKTKRKRLLVCLGSGLVFFLVLLSLTALFFGGRYEGLAMNGTAVLLGSGIMAALGLRGQGGNPKRRKKLGSR